MSYIRLPEGRRLDILNPRALQIELSDIIRGLSKEQRFSNQAEVPWSVLDHSLHVHRLLRDKDASVYARRAGLLHDASEAYMHDLASPYKRECPDYIRLEKKLQAAIRDRFSLVTTPEEDDLIHSVDMQALAIEAHMCLGLTEAELPDWGFKPAEGISLPWHKVEKRSAELMHWRVLSKNKVPMIFRTLCQKERII